MNGGLQRSKFRLCMHLDLARCGVIGVSPVNACSSQPDFDLAELGALQPRQFPLQCPTIWIRRQAYRLHMQAAFIKHASTRMLH
eukprot:357125-Chlamydomonas_euryale.AAC.2